MRLSAYAGSSLIAIAEGVGLFVIFCCALALRRIVKALLLPIGSLGLTALQNLPGFLRF